MRAKLNKNGCIDIIDYDKLMRGIEEEYQKRLIENSVTDGIISAINSKSKKKLTEDDDKLIVIRKQLDDQHAAIISKYDGYKEYVEENYTGKEQPTDTDVLVPYFEETSDKIIRHLKLQKNEPWHVRQKIEKLKKELADSDYKIAKAYEAQLRGDPAPYDDIKKVVGIRQDWRKQINELEKLLES